MRIVIDIPDEVYKASQIIEVKHEDTIQIPLEVLANATPLEKVLGEIKGKIQEEIKRQYIPYTGGHLIYNIDPNKVLEIIDSYISGKE